MNKKRKILIVDDIDINIELISESLKSQNYEILTASDGVEAIFCVEKSPPDLILLDIQMPRMNGFEVCQKLKSDPLTRSIPIIIVTASQDLSSKLKSYELGANGFLTKPFNKFDLLSCVNSNLRIVELLETEKQKNEEINKLASFISQTEFLSFQNFSEFLKTIIGIDLSFSDEIEKKEISLKEIIYTNFEKFKTVFEFQNIESDIPPALPNIFADEKHIANLIFNMLLFSFSTSDTKEKKIKISSFINLKGGICIKVWNNGENNLFKNELKNILLENSFSKNGFLIQLFGIQKIVSIHKGSVSINSEFNKGIELSCVIPVK